MGLISNAVNSTFESLGNSMMNVGEWWMKGGAGFWKSSSDIAIAYARKDPMSTVNAWKVVTGNIYNTMLAVAASLSVLFFVLGWLNESIDIRTNFTLEAMFRFFIRYIIAASLIVNSLTFVTAVTKCGTALVSTLSVTQEEEDLDGLFDNVRQELEDGEDNGGTWLSYGIMIMFGGMIGGIVIFVCGIQLLITILSRLFKLLLCIPFAPLAFAGFAGGREFAHTGISWIRTYVGYCLEAAVIVLALMISFGLFKDPMGFEIADGIEGVILQICEYCVPMIAACACVKSADTVIRRCLGLG